mgnify:CR=1 FL=1|jgi:hypothetical protein
MRSSLRNWFRWDGLISLGELVDYNDRTVVLTANDHAFCDGFDGFIVRNGGSDYFVKSIIGYSK